MVPGAVVTVVVAGAGVPQIEKGMVLTPHSSSRGNDNQDCVATVAAGAFSILSSSPST